MKTIRLQRIDGRFTRVPVLAVRGVWAIHRSIVVNRRHHYTITHIPTRLAITTRITSRRVADKTLRECAALPGDWSFITKPTVWTEPLRAANRIASRFGDGR